MARKLNIRIPLLEVQKRNLEKHVFNLNINSVCLTFAESERNLSMKRSAENDDSNGESDRLEPKKKISFGLMKPTAKVLDQGYNPLSKNANMGKTSFQRLSLTKANVLQKPVTGQLPKPKPSSKAALAFNQDDEDDDDEEMPPEAKMRMKNIGRDTPTSSGPNSFGKGKMGFCDSKKIFERQLKEKVDGSTASNTS